MNSSKRSRLVARDSTLIVAKTFGPIGRAGIARQAQVRFRGEADMNRRQEPTESVENDPHGHSVS